MSELESDLIMTWDQSSVQRQSTLFDWNTLTESPLKIAFDSFRVCQESIMRRYQLLKSVCQNKQVHKLYQYVQKLYQHDEWVIAEHPGGFNDVLMSDDNMEEVLELSEAAI